MSAAVGKRRGGRARLKSTYTWRPRSQTTYMISSKVLHLQSVFVTVPPSQASALVGHVVPWTELED
jgi:hypothetical protein